MFKVGLPWWSTGKESASLFRGHGFDPWSGKIPHATGQRSPCAAAAEPSLPTLCSATGEATAVRSLCIAARGSLRVAAYVKTQCGQK